MAKARIKTLLLLAAGMLGVGLGGLPSSSRETACEFCVDKSVPREETKRTYLGFQACLRCHYSGVQGQVELPGGGKLDLMKEQWVLYREYSVWAKEDKHGQAYTVLLNQRSREIGKQLGQEQIHRDRRCLACHTGFPLADMPAKNGLVDDDLAKKLDINLGVSCEGCHGPAGDRRVDDRILSGWLEPHAQQPTLPYNDKTWRFRAPHDKQADFGFVDVRTPSSKARLCVSCHIGDLEQGRFVTHEMYAAGHPPLPGFELETFSKQMPAHSREFGDKVEQVRAVFLKNSLDPMFGKNYRPSDLHRTKAMLAGALVSAGASLQLTAQVADEELASPVPRPAWPELALFDCYACHHELANDSWRQTRKGTKPGRPALQAWPFVLSKIAAETLDTDFEKQLAGVYRAVNARPFGVKKDVVKDARQAAAWLTAIGKQIEQKPLDPAAGESLLRRLVEIGARETLDYDGARQLTWAMQVLSGELKQESVAAKIDAMGAELLLLNVRGGNKAVTALPGESGPRQTVEVALEAVLPFAARYHPGRFQQKCRALLETLSK